MKIASAGDRRLARTAGHSPATAPIASVASNPRRINVVVIRVMEAKAGKAARTGLSSEAATKFADLSEKKQQALLRDAARELRHRRPDLAKTPLKDILKDHNKDVMDIVTKEFPQTNEWGQATKTSQRLGVDIDDAGNDIPAEILIDGVRRKVRFAGAAGRPQITGMLPSDLPKGTMAKLVSKRQGVNLDMMNVKGINQAKLKALSEQIAQAKGLPTK